jgi:antitoxin ParD1/3/4
LLQFVPLVGIELTPEQVRWLEAEVAAGRFASVEDGVRMAVAEMMIGSIDEADDLDWAKPLVDEAIAEIERGESLPLDQVRAELDAYLKSIGGR